MKRMGWSYQQYMGLPEGYLSTLQELLDEEDREMESLH
jgi:hypothetical protein